MMPDEEVVKTDLLIVGAGPAGASLACFLAAHGRYLDEVRVTQPVIQPGNKHTSLTSRQ
jgi:glycine/D-amino acid oxidase-like deaminating enzyme